MVLYLDILSVAALLRRGRPVPVSPRGRFAVLVPAHDEETLLSRLLQSLVGLDYPTDLYDIHVVADNCTDGTAAVAAEWGVYVHERWDTEQRGKGFALRWLLHQLDHGDPRYDAFVVVDADSVVAPNFLRVMNRHLLGGDAAVQSYYGVLNRDESPAAALRYVALVLFNDLRPRGRDALGLSAGLRGNGMCFRRDVLERFGWDAFSLAEDVEFHLRMVEAGIRVAYAADTVVLGEMPATLGESRSQNVRWERGRLQMLRTFGPRLLGRGIRERNPVLIDAIAEQIIPPLSVLTGVSTIALLCTLVLRIPSAVRLAALVLAGQIGYVVTGLIVARSPLAFYLVLFRAPRYIAWKVWIYVVAATRLGDTTWIRTSRRPSAGHDSA
jgi:cellulose synthase/poly-beta-1,6-N-acetylglucosamine synthase-like glycosyltransferase